MSFEHWGLPTNGTELNFSNNVLRLDGVNSAWARLPYSNMKAVGGGERRIDGWLVVVIPFLFPLSSFFLFCLCC